MKVGVIMGGISSEREISLKSGNSIVEKIDKNKYEVVPIVIDNKEDIVNEIDGQDYYFVTPEEFQEKIDRDAFLEYAQVQYGCFYGTPKKEIEEKLESGFDVILEIDVEGAKQVKEKFPETILIFIMAPSMEEVKRRIKERKTESAEQIIKRFKRAYQEINEVNKYNYVVVNDEVDEAVKKIEAILISEKCRVDRIEEIRVENEEEIIHEFLIDKDFDNDTKHIV